MQRNLVCFYTRGVWSLVKRKKKCFIQQIESELDSNRLSSFLAKEGKHAVLQLSTMQDVLTVKALFK